jgi:hypothetical protein
VEGKRRWLTEEAKKKALAALSLIKAYNEKPQDQVENNFTMCIIILKFVYT